MLGYFKGNLTGVLYNVLNSNMRYYSMNLIEKNYKTDSQLIKTIYSTLYIYKHQIILYMFYFFTNKAFLAVSSIDIIL